MTYDEFRAWYVKTHQSSVPVEPRQVRSVYPRWLRIVVLVMFICAALLSGVHTVPTVYAGIERQHVHETVRQIVALASFVAIDLAIFVATYAKLRGNKRLVTTMLIVVFTVALVSNVNSVMKALGSTAGTDFWTTAVGVILGFGAPLIALLAGEIFVSMHTADQEASSEAEDKYRREMKDFEAIVLREFKKYTQANKPVKSGEFHETSNGVHETSVKLHEVNFSPKPRVKLHEVAREIHENGDADLSSQEMMTKYGISLGSTTKIREMLKNGSGHGG